MNIERSVSYYERGKDAFLGEYTIDIDLDIIKKLWDSYDDDPLYYMIYPIGIKQRAKIEELLGMSLDFEKYEYFLECYSV